MTNLERMLAFVPPPRLSLRDALERRMESASSRPFQSASSPSVLCHYTSMEGLRGILLQQAFRATDHHDVDDKGELSAAEDRIDAVLADLAAGASPVGRDVLMHFHEFYSVRRIRDYVTIYLSCFTSHRDELYHWQEFARTGGACLVLKAFPNETAPQMYRGAKLARSAHEVVYTESVWEDRLRAGFSAVLSEYELTRSDAALWGFADDARRFAVVQMALVAAYAGLSSKRSKYSREVEWRWIAVPDPDDIHRLVVEERNGKKFLTLRFREAPKMFDLEEVIVWGPDTDALTAEAGAILLAAGYPAGNPPVRVSTHPFAPKSAP